MKPDEYWRGPKAEDLERLAEQFRPGEWSILLRSQNFIEAACVSLTGAAEVASTLLGRKISADAMPAKTFPPAP